MTIFVSADWVQERLGSPEILVLDPRRPAKYLQGHLKNAVNSPVATAFDREGRLLPAAELARWIGAAGLDDSRKPVVYDSFDGRNAALLAWILSYLGRSDVHLLNVFLEGWVAEEREVFYRPVTPVAREFSARVREDIRASRKDVSDAAGWKLVDFRSQDEYTGKLDTEGRPGHIPGAINFVWQELLGENHQFLAPRETLEQRLGAAGIARDDRVVAYCRTGLRAAVGCLALEHLGRTVRLYDGSYADWARSGLPVEATQAGSE